MNTKPKPEILSISNTAKTHIFEIQSVNLKFSNGELRTYERFKPNNRCSVMILPIENNKLIMVEEYAVGTERYELGFPKGLIDPNETPEQSANRELKEEIGLGANQLIHLRTIITNPNYMNSPMHIFIATDFYPCKLEGDEPEPLTIVRYPLNKIDDLIQRTDFIEAKNLVALYALRDFLKQQK